MQGPLLTFPTLKRVLVDIHKCSMDSTPIGAGRDDDGRESPPIYAFFRVTEGDGPLMSTIVVRHDDEPLLPTNLRSFLARLDLTPDDIWRHL